MTTGDVGVNEFLYATESFSRISYKRHTVKTQQMTVFLFLRCFVICQYVSFVLTLEGGCETASCHYGSTVL